MKASENGATRRERRHFSAAQKGAIVKAHLVDGVPISDVCDRHHIQPAQFYQWQKQLFENAAVALERKPGRPIGPTPAERQVEALRAKLATKNEVIAELMEENVLLKKLDGAI
jgi:transposase-like protein